MSPLKSIGGLLTMELKSQKWSAAIPFSWCAPAYAHGPGGSTDAGTLYHLSRASPDHSAQCSPPYENHLHKGAPNKEVKTPSQKLQGKGAVVLTHVELSNKACHVVMFEVFWQNFFGKASLVKHVETGPSLKERPVRFWELVNRTF